MTVFSWAKSALLLTSVAVFTPVAGIAADLDPIAQELMSDPWAGAYGGVYGSFSGDRKRETNLDGDVRYAAPEDNDVYGGDTVNQSAFSYAGFAAPNTAQAFNNYNNWLNRRNNNLTAPLDRSDINQKFNLERNKEVGVLFGYNFADTTSSPYIFGIEGSVGYSKDSDGTQTWTRNGTTFNYGGGGVSGFGFNYNVRNLNNGTLNETLTTQISPSRIGGDFVARAGFLASEDLMIFGLGGVGVREVNYKVDYRADATITSHGVGTQYTQTTIGHLDETDQKISWIAGAGGEMIISQGLRLRGEYRYSYTKGETYDVDVTRTSSNNFLGTPGPDTAEFEVKGSNDHAFRISLIMPFN